MKTKIIYFVSGLIVGAVLMVLILQYKNPNYSSYHYTDIDKRERFIQFLEKKQILYSYTITHLKIHRVKPHIDKSFEKQVMLEFDEQEDLLRESQ